MKRLLSVVAILALAASLLPGKSQASLRGAFDYITNGGPFLRGKFSPVLRGGNITGTGTAASPRRERWVSFVALSAVIGSESVGEIWLLRNIDQSVARGNDPQPLEVDPTGAISYIDPCWSKDGKWLAYVKTDNNVSQASIYVQQFDLSTASGGGQALSAPFLIADGSGGRHHRHPAFNSTGTQIAYDSDQNISSLDIYTVNVTLDATAHTATVNEASRTRHKLGMEGTPELDNILNTKGEFKPDYSPDDTKIAYVSNRYGPFQIQIGTLTADGTFESSVGVENNVGLVTHDNPSWAPNGTELYYDAPSNEDPANPQDIWRINLVTGAKCNIFVDLAGDVDPDVSQYTNVTRDGLPYNYFTFISQAAGIGVQVWLGQEIQNCYPALPIQVQANPFDIDITQGTASDVIKLTISHPLSNRQQGYVARQASIGGEGLRFRNNIIPSPTLMGLPMPSLKHDANLDCTNMYYELTGGAPDSINCADLIDFVLGNGAIGRWLFVEDTSAVVPGVTPNHKMIAEWNRRAIQARIVALGLVNKYVPLTFRQYTNLTGRQMLGFAYLRLARANLLAGSLVLEQNFPNPFNPVTNIKFAQDKPGNVEVRVFNVRGELVRTVTNQWYPQGLHTVTWDGKTTIGAHASSGVYYIRAKSALGTDVIKAVLAK